MYGVRTVATARFRFGQEGARCGWSRRRLRTHRKAERDIGGRGTLKPFPRSSTRQPAAAAERCSACHQPRGAEEAISFR